MQISFMAYLLHVQLHFESRVLSPVCDVLSTNSAPVSSSFLDAFTFLLIALLYLFIFPCSNAPPFLLQPLVLFTFLQDLKSLREISMSPKRCREHTPWTAATVNELYTFKMHTEIPHPHPSSKKQTCTGCVTRLIILKTQGLAKMPILSNLLISWSLIWVAPSPHCPAGVTLPCCCELPSHRRRSSWKSYENETFLDTPSFYRTGCPGGLYCRSHISNRTYDLTSVFVKTFCKSTSTKTWFLHWLPKQISKESRTWQLFKRYTVCQWMVQYNSGWWLISALLQEESLTEGIVT